MLAFDARDRLPNLVEAVYDSVTEPDRWQQTLETVCHVAEGCLATLAVVDTVSNTARMAVSCGDAGLVQALTEYGTNVPFYSALPRMEIDVPFTVDCIYALQGPDTRQTWLDSRIVQEWVMPNRLDDFFWISLMRQSSRIGTLLVVTDKDRRPITPDDLALMSSLAPHVRRAVTIGDMFEAERRTAEIFRSVLDGLSHPVLIVDGEMQVLFANPAAEALLGDGVVASVARGRLAFRFGCAHAALTRAVELGQHDEFALGPSGINVPLAQAAAPAVAHVMPLARRDPSARLSQRAAAAIFVAAAGSTPLPALDAIAALFGLTAAERRVAGHVAAGMTRQDIALANGVSDGTVKTQLGAIFDKTGANDQRELELLIRDLSPPVTQPAH